MRYYMMWRRLNQWGTRFEERVMSAEQRMYAPLDWVTLYEIGT